MFDYIIFAIFLLTGFFLLYKQDSYKVKPVVVKENEYKIRSTTSKENWIKFFHKNETYGKCQYYYEEYSVNKNGAEPNLSQNKNTSILCVNIKQEWTSNKYTLFCPAKIKISSQEAMFERIDSCIDFNCIKIAKTSRDGCHYRKYFEDDLFGVLVSIIYPNHKANPNLKSELSPLQNLILREVEKYGEIKTTFKTSRSDLFRLLQKTYPVWSDNEINEIINKFFKLSQTNSTAPKENWIKFCQAHGDDGANFYYYDKNSLILPIKTLIDAKIIHKTTNPSFNPKLYHVKIDLSSNKATVKSCLGNSDKTTYFELNKNNILCELVNVIKEDTKKEIQKTPKHMEQTRNTKSNGVYTEEQIMNMTWKEFEKFTTEIFNNMGYIAKTTSPTNDSGKDVIAIKDNTTYFIECKHWKESSRVGREYIQKLVGAAVGKGVKNVIFITTGRYGKNAIKYANDKDCIVNIQLWSMNEILKAVNTTNFNPDSNIDKLCPKCNSKLILRNGLCGLFLGCESYPNCKHTEKI